MKRECLLIWALLIAGTLLFCVDPASGQGYPGYPVGGAFVPGPGPEAPMPSPGAIAPVPIPIPHQPPPTGDTFIATTGIPETGTAPGTTGVVPPGSRLPLPPAPPGAPSYPATAPGTGVPPLRPTYGPLTGDVVWDPVTRTYGIRSSVGSETAPFGVFDRAPGTRAAPGTGPGLGRETVPGPAGPDPRSETSGAAGATAPFGPSGAAGPVPGGLPAKR